MHRRGIARRAVLVVALLGAIAGLVACGDSGGDSGSTSSSGASSGSAGERLRFIYVSSNPSSAPIGAIINNAFEDAGEQLDVDVEYRTPARLTFSPTEVKRLLENAIAAKPDGLVVSDYQPDALNATIKSATDQGIPVVLSSTGAGQVEQVGALTYVGNDEVAAGRLGGEELSKAGARHALLISIPPGLPIVDERVEGFKDGFDGKVTVLAVRDFSDITGTTNAILATLQKDPSIDGVFDVGSALTPAELAARQQLGARADEMKWAVLDIGPQELQSVKDGRLEFALDQQPYLQGYLPVLFLKQYKELGLRPVGVQVPTGPAVVTEDNVDQVLELAGDKLR
jgi:simple sugar transport system substrate-binding protein